MTDLIKKILVIVLTVCIASSLVSCAGLFPNETSEPDVTESEPQRKVPLPPTIKDLDKDFQ